MNIDAIIVGAGQAGLAASYELTQRNVEHVVLERGDIGESWRRRWDSFCLVTPNWSVQLPGFPYDGDDPDGFMPRDEIVAYLERYAASFEAPVRARTIITGVEPLEDGLIRVHTDKGAWTSGALILATGAFQRPLTPKGVETLPNSVLQLPLSDFTNERALPEGDVLVIGGGQSGCQIAEELLEAGRAVTLACGRAPWAPRRIGAHDLFWWFVESGFADAMADTIPDEARLFANVLATGHDRGHDLNLRTLKDKGARLVGHFLGAEGMRAKFAPDLAESIAWGDARYDQFRDLVHTTADKLGLSRPALPDPEPFTAETPTEIDLNPVGTVMFTGGFRPDYASWLPWPDAFDADGFPLQSDGASAVVGGLYFVGLHFLRKRKSALLYGVGEDAAIVADKVAARSGSGSH